MSFNQGGFNGGRRGGGGGDDFVRELQDGFDQISRSLKGKVPWIFSGFILLIVGIGVMGSFYTVDPDEQAVVLRFGKYVRTEDPGLQYKLPFGIERIAKLKTLQRKRMEFGFRSVSDEDRQSGRTSYDKRNFGDESQMVTGDLNVAVVEWIVQYRISDPNKYLFQSRSPRRNIRDVSESIMRRVVGDRLVGEVLTTARAEIRDQAKQLMQELLDRYDIGITIEEVELQDVNPPEVVKASFNEVNAAKQEQERLINEAEGRYNRVIPEARGTAEKTISNAEGYATRIVNEAKGDAEKFDQVLTEYKRAPDITRKRIYLETMEKLYTRFDKLVVVDPQVKGVLPVFGKSLTGESK